MRRHHEGTSADAPLASCESVGVPIGALSGHIVSFPHIHLLRPEINPERLFAFSDSKNLDPLRVERTGLYHSPAKCQPRRSPMLLAMRPVANPCGTHPYYPKH